MIVFRFDVTHPHGPVRSHTPYYAVWEDVAEGVVAFYPFIPEADIEDRSKWRRRDTDSSFDSAAEVAPGSKPMARHRYARSAREAKEAYIEDSKEGARYSEIDLATLGLSEALPNC